MQGARVAFEEPSSQSKPGLVNSPPIAATRPSYGAAADVGCGVAVASSCLLTACSCCLSKRWALRSWLPQTAVKQPRLDGGLNCCFLSRLDGATGVGELLRSDAVRNW